MYNMMPSLQTMEYLGRLGLVSRKNKKERVASLPHIAELRETKRCTAEAPSSTCTPRRPSNTASCLFRIGAIKEPNSCDETARTQQAITSSDTNVDMADSFFPRTLSTSGLDAFIDIEFIEYERQVQARAQALDTTSHHTFLGAPGGRHAWKTLIFWKRRRTVLPTSPCLTTPSSTPVYHSAFQPVSGRRSRHHHGSSRRAVNSAAVPLYMSDEFSTSSMRAWWEPVARGGTAGQLDAQVSCNRSPYVALGARSQRLPAAAPLYLV